MRLPWISFALYLLAFHALSHLAKGDDLPKEMPGILYGTVSNDYGAMAGERIAVFRIASDRGRPAMTKACASITDADGGYRCDGLSPGDYLVVTMEPLQLDRTHTTLLPAFSFFPGTSDLGTATFVRLRSSDYQSANFLLSSRDTYSVRGKISGVNAKTEISLYALADSGLECPLPIRATQGTGGTFSFVRVPPGRYRVQAQWAEHMEEMIAAAEIEVSDRDLSGIALVPSTTTDIKIRLKSVDVTNELVTEGSATPEVFFEEIDTGDQVRPVQDKTKNGVYLFPKMKPGTYTLSISSPSSACIESLSVGERELSNPIKFDGDTISLTINATFRQVCGSFRGSLVPATKGEVLLATDKFVTARTAMSDENGNFVIYGVPAGEYHIYSWSSLKDIPFRDRLFLRNLRDHSSIVDVSGRASITGVEVLRIN